MNTVFISYIEEHQAIIEKLRFMETEFQSFCDIAVHSIRNGGKLMFCGNGGSAADSQHLAAELTGRLIRDRPAMAGIALTTDSSALTCIANDYSFDEIFSRQIAGIGKKLDTVVLISTSGNSRNLILAAKQARIMGIKVISLLGKDGGELLSLSDSALVVPSATTARIQEMHILLGHILCRQIELSLYPELC